MKITTRIIRYLPRFAALPAIAALGTCPLRVCAETVVVPLAFKTNEGGSGSSVLNDNIRLQEIYAASTLPLNPILISGMRFRPSAVAGAAFSSTIENIQINLSTTRIEPAALSREFAANVGTNDTVVFSGALTLFSQFIGPEAGPKDFDIVIPFTTPYLYEPADGNLLVDFRNFSGSTVTYVDAGPSVDQRANRAFALGANATTASTIDFGADVLQFTYTSLPTPPVILTQPENQYAPVGGTTEFSVVARGTDLTYQWSRDDEPLPQATNSTLLFTHVQLEDAGAYAVMVANSFGAVTSRLASLVVTNPAPPTILAQPTSQSVVPGGTARFSVTAFSLAPILGYQWQFDGAALVAATNSSLVLSNVQPNQAGVYTVVVSNAFGFVQSAGATLVVTNTETLILPPAFELIEGRGGSSVLSDNIRLQEVYSSSLFPAGPLVITALRFRPSALYGRPFSTTISNLQLNLSSTRVAPGALSTSFAANVGPDDTSVFSGEIALSSSATGPSTGPKDFDILVPLAVPFLYDPEAGNLLLDVRSSGGAVSLVDAGAPAQGQVSRVFSLGANSQMALAADHGADVIQIAYQAAPRSPSIFRHPTNLVVMRGDDATFTVTARGTPPLAYQWLFNENPLPDATSPTLALPRVEPAAAGAYRVVVANGLGAVTSQVATLTVEMGRHLALSTPAQRQEGSTVAVLLELASEGDVAGMTFAIHYNPDYLRNADLVWAHALSGSFNSLSHSPGEIRASFALSEPVPAGTQLVATVEFLLRSVPEDLETPLNLNIVDVSDAMGESITRANRSRGSIVRIARRAILGDNNANGRLDVGDATVILRHLSHLEVTRSWDVTGNDLNRNSGLDSGDAIKALRAAANLDPQPGGGGFAPAAAPGGVLPPESIVLAPGRVALAGKSTITMQVRLAHIRSAFSAAALTVDYPTNALRLLNAQAYRTGALVPANALVVWNVSPQQNNFSAQDGHLTLAVSSAQPWAESNGVLAELTFQVQPGAAAQYAWPLRVREAEISPNGYGNRYLLATGGVALGRPALPGQLTRPSRDPSGHFQFDLRGDAGATYLIESSVDLIHWTEAQRLWNQTGVLLFTDPNPAGTGSRFYRSRALEQ